MIIGNLEVYGIIYDIRNKINNKHYIGQTARDFKKRYFYNGDSDIERIYNLNKAVKERGNGYYNPHLVSSIEKYGFENFEVNKTLDVAFSKEELDIKEKVWIGIFDSFKKGYNRNIGGLGNKGAIRISGKENPSSRSVIQLSLEGDFIKQWDCITDIYRGLKIGASDIVGVCSSRYGKKSAGGFLWVYEDDYDKNKTYTYINKAGEYNKIAVVRLNLSGVFIDEFQSISEATRVVAGSDVTKIGMVCKNKRKSHNGYVWVYKDDYINGYKLTSKVEINNIPKEVVQLNKNGEYLKKYESMSIASRETKINISKICLVCQNKRKTTGGYKWMYYKDYKNTIEYLSTILLENKCS